MGPIVLCILAGGRSSRFGRPKTNVTVGGEPILAWQVDRLTQGLIKIGFPIESVWINLAPGVAEPPGLGRFDRIVLDPTAYEGPLAGILATLGEAPEEAIVVFVPVDMPLIQPRSLVRLIDALSPSNGIVRSVRFGGEMEPLPFVCLVGPALNLIREAWKDGVRGPVQRRGREGVIEVPIPDREVDQWRGFNTPEEWDSIKGQLPGNANEESGSY